MGIDSRKIPIFKLGNFHTQKYLDKLRIFWQHWLPSLFLSLSLSVSSSLLLRQVQQAADENTDPSGRKQIWRCESSRSKTTIQEYAEYQKTFSEVSLTLTTFTKQICVGDDLYLTIRSSLITACMVSHITILQDEVVESEILKNADSAAEKSQRKDLRKSLEFGTNVDLSDSKIWSVQLQEINKLPKFLRVSCNCSANSSVHHILSILKCYQ